MRSSSAHGALTRIMYPGISTGLVNTVNHAIDNPTYQSIQLNHIMRKPKFGFIENYLTHPIAARSAPHREYGHSYMDGLMLAAQYGPQAMQAFMAHMAQDMMRDTWVKSHGMYHADLLEASLLYNLHRSNRPRKRYWY
jgi:hypothetical protein